MDPVLAGVARGKKKEWTIRNLGQEETMITCQNRKGFPDAVPSPCREGRERKASTETNTIPFPHQFWIRKNQSGVWSVKTDCLPKISSLEKNRKMIGLVLNFVGGLFFRVGGSSE